MQRYLIQYCSMCSVVYFVPMFRVFVPLFRFCTTVSFLHYCSVFCTTVPFFHNGTKTEQFVFVPLFRLFCTSVPFSHNRTNMEQCILYHWSVFLYHCSVFCHTVSFFPQRNKNGTVYFVPLFRVFVPLFRFCTTVPFFCTTVPFFLQQNKNGIVYFVPLFRVYVPLFCFSTTVLFSTNWGNIIFSVLKAKKWDLSQPQREQVKDERLSKR